MASKGTRVVYITGNHDEALRKYGHFEMGNIQLTDKIVFEINGEKNWVFHGDVFDRTTKGWAKLLAKLGGYGYDLLILINSSVNFLCSLFGREKMSLSKQVKNGVKKAVSWINNFEQTVCQILDYCELPFEEACIEFYKNKRAVKTPSAQQVRQPIYTSGLDYWKNYEPYLEELKKYLKY